MFQNILHPCATIMISNYHINSFDIPYKKKKKNRFKAVWVTTAAA